MPGVLIWLPEAELDVGAGVEVEVTVDVGGIIEVELVLEGVELLGNAELLDGTLEELELDVLVELEVIVDAAAFSVELEIDFDVEEAVNFTVDEAFAEVVERLDEVVVLTLSVELAVWLVEVAVIPTSLASWLLKLLMALNRSRCCSGILISRVFWDHRVIVGNLREMSLCAQWFLKSFAGASYAVSLPEFKAVVESHHKCRNSGKHTTTKDIRLAGTIAEGGIQVTCFLPTHP